jgi:3-hydroxyisobutyrate dehydrogenase-like beta-hydroxyacid dehydrogenase
MVQRLASAGHSPVVWNRSGVPTELSHLQRATSPAEAVAQADIVFSMVTDDEASRAVWEEPVIGALGALRAGSLAIECSTLTPAWCQTLASRVAGRGAQFLDAPVVGTRPQAAAGQLVFLVGGTEEVLDRARPLLGILGGAAHFLGPTPSGARAKLIANALYGVQVAALAELLGLAVRSGLPVEPWAEALATLPVMSPSAKAALTAMRSDQFAPLFPLRLVEKDFRYALAEAAAHGSSLPVAASVHRQVAQALDGGLADENITALAKQHR